MDFMQKELTGLCGKTKTIQSSGELIDDEVSKSVQALYFPSNSCIWDYSINKWSYTYLFCTKVKSSCQKAWINYKSYFEKIFLVSMLDKQCLNNELGVIITFSLFFLELVTPASASFLVMMILHVYSFVLVQPVVFLFLLPGYWFRLVL